MTNLLSSDYADSGELVSLNLAVVDTHVLDFGETTQAIRPYDVAYPALRRPEVDETHTVRFALPTDETAIQGPQQPPPPIPPNPGPVLPPRRSWWGRLMYVGQHRAERWTR